MQESNDELLTTKAVQERFGGISAMTIWRWCRDEALDFPAPIRIRGRRYWRARDLDEFERRCAA